MSRYTEEKKRERDRQGEEDTPHDEARARTKAHLHTREGEGRTHAREQAKKWKPLALQLVRNGHSTPASGGKKSVFCSFLFVRMFLCFIHVVVP